MKTCVFSSRNAVVSKCLGFLLLAGLAQPCLMGQQPQTPAKPPAMPSKEEAQAKALKMRDAHIQQWKNLPTEDLMAKVRKLSAMDPSSAGPAQAQRLELRRIQALSLAVLLAQRSKDPSITPAAKESIRGAAGDAKASFKAFNEAYVKTQPWAYSLPAEPPAETPAPAEPAAEERPLGGVWNLKSVLEGHPTTLTVTVTGDTVVMKNDLTEWTGDVDWLFDESGKKIGFELVATGKPPINYRRIRSPFTLDARGVPHPAKELRLYEVNEDGSEKDLPIETVPQTLTSESGTPLETGALVAGKTFGFPMVTPSKAATASSDLSGEWDFHMKTLKAIVTTAQGVMQLRKVNNSSPMKVTQQGDQVTMEAQGNAALGTIKGTFDGKTLAYKQVDANGKLATYTLTLDPATGILTGIMEDRQESPGAKSEIQVEMKMTRR